MKSSSYSSLSSVLKKFQEKGIYFAAARVGPLSEDNSKEVQDQIIFIAENGSVVEFQG